MMEFNPVAGVSYNTYAKRGVLIGAPVTNFETGITTQILSVFDVIQDSPYVIERASANLTVDFNPDSSLSNKSTRVIQSDVSEEGFVYVL